MAQNNLIPEGYVGIRDYATGAGGTVGWDPATKAVSINNQTLDPTSYVNVGGRTYANPNTIQGILKPPEQQVVQQAQSQQPAQPDVNNQQNLQAQMNNVLAQLQQFQSQQTAPQQIQAPQQVQAPAPFQYNPQSDPAYQAMVPALTRSVLEQLNARGIVNSSISPDSVSQAIASILPQLASQASQNYYTGAGMGIDVAKYNQGVGLDVEKYNQGAQRQYGQDQFGMSQDILGALSGFENQQYERGITERQFKLQEAEAKAQAEQRALDNAWRRVTDLGYVDNVASQVLGLDVSTPSFKAREAYEQRKMQNEQFQAELKLQRDKLTQDASQFYAGLKQDQSQFSQNLGQRQSEFNTSMTQRQAEQSNKPIELDPKNSSDTYFEAIGNLEEDTTLTKAEAKAYAQLPEVKNSLSAADYKRLLDYIEENY